MHASGYFSTGNNLNLYSNYPLIYATLFCIFLLPHTFSSFFNYNFFFCCFYIYILTDRKGRKSKYTKETTTVRVRRKEITLLKINYTLRALNNDTFRIYDLRLHL